MGHLKHKVTLKTCHSYFTTSFSITLCRLVLRRNLTSLSLLNFNKPWLDMDVVIVFDFSLWDDPLLFLKVPFHSSNLCYYFHYCKKKKEEAHRVSSLSPSAQLPGKHEASSSVSLCSLCCDILPHNSLKAMESTNHGLRLLKPGAKINPSFLKLFS
jgi:hypothetical protein